jgi:hypothetical protein
MEGSFKSRLMIKDTLWVDSGYSGIAFLTDPLDIEPPAMGLMFRDKNFGNQIFNHWINIVGKEDHHEALRISIIEGDLPGEKAGYSVIVGSNMEGEIACAKEQGSEIDPRFYIGASRVIRMLNPQSVHLANFKAAYEKHKKYILIPVYSPDLKEMAPQFQFAILKRRINFRNVENISEDDVDSITLGINRMPFNQN